MYEKTISDDLITNSDSSCFMNIKKPATGCPLVVIHNIDTLSIDEIQLYCMKYDRRVRCYRKVDKNKLEYVQASFYSSKAAALFLDDRPHFINHCRINASPVDHSFIGPRIVCVRTGGDLTITEDMLYEYTSASFGRVLTCALFADRGYAFIEFAELADAHRALAASKHNIAGHLIRFHPRQPLPEQCRLVHFGNLHSNDYEKIRFRFPTVQDLTIHTTSQGQIYALARFSSLDCKKLLAKRPYCFNGRVWRIFVNSDDKFAERTNFLLVHDVPKRLNDYHLLEYFSQFGHVLNCHSYDQTKNVYRIQYAQPKSLNQALEQNRTPTIKGARLYLKRDRDD